MAQGILSIKIRADASPLERALKIAGRDMAAFSQKALAIGRGITLGFTAPVIAMGSSFLNAAASMDQLERGMAAIMGSSSDAAKELNKLKESAKLPGLAFEEAVRGSIRLQSVGLQADQARKVLETFGKAIATTGGGAVELEAVQYQMTQMISKNKILAEDFKPIQSAVPLIGKAMQQAFGTDNIEGVRALGISAKDFTMRLTESLRVLPEVQNSTGGVRNSFDNLKDSIKFASAEMGKVILKNIDLDAIIADVVGSLTKLTEWFGGLSDGQQKAILNTTKYIAVLGGLSWIIGQLVSSFGNITYLLGQVVEKIIKLDKVTNTLSLTTTGYIVIAASLVAILYSIFKAYKEANGPIETFNDYLSTGAKNAKQETAEFNFLMEALKDVNISSSTRKQLLEDLNTKYSQYLPKLLTEKTDLQSIAAAQKDGNEALKAKFKLLAQQGVKQKQYEKIVELQTKLLELETTPVKKQNVNTSISGLDAKASLIPIDERAAAIEKLNIQIDVLTKAYDKSVNSIEKYNTEQEKANEVIKAKQIANLEYKIKDLNLAIQVSSNEYGKNNVHVVALKEELSALQSQLDSLKGKVDENGETIVNNSDKIAKALGPYDLLKNKLSDIEEAYRNILVTQGQNSSSAELLRQKYYEVAGELKKINEEYDKLENRKIIVDPLPQYNNKNKPSEGANDFEQVFTPYATQKLQSAIGIVDGVTKSTREFGIAYQGLQGMSEVGNIVAKNMSPVVQAMTQAEFVMESFKDVMNEALGSAVTAFTEMALAGETSFGKLAYAAVNAARQVIAANIKEGVTALVKNILAGPTGKVLGPGALAVAGAAGVGASVLFNTLINKIVPPKLAKGGLAFGPTMATVGDNPNASFDPEVIAPLSKLKSMLGDVSGGSPYILSTRISGSDLIVIMERSKNINQRIR